jgi:hypothetical protein
MKKDWTYLTRLTGGKPITVRRVEVGDEGIAIEGNFELPPLAKLQTEDQVFVAVFKSRLNRIGGLLDFVEVETTADHGDVLDRLERGEINVNEAIESLNKGDDHE